MVAQARLTDVSRHSLSPLAARWLLLLLRRTPMRKVRRATLFSHRSF